MRRAPILVLIALLFAASAAAATRHVRKSGTDIGNTACAAATPCLTLTAAIAVAQPGDTIQMGKGKFHEPAGVLIDKDLTIVGAGFSTWLQGSASWAPSRVITVTVNAQVSLSGLQVLDGRAELGGGIRNFGSLRLDDVRIRGNRADEGGGIYNDGFLMMTRGEIALNAGYGALVNGSAGTALLTATSVAANDGPGIVNGLGVLIVRDSQVVVNRAPLFNGTRTGSAGLLSQGGAVRLTNVTVSGNEGIAVHAISGADVEMTHVTVADNTFGLIADGQASVGLRNTILSANHSADCLVQGGNVGGDGNVVGETCLTWPTGYNFIGVPAKLAALAYNGGLTWTHALLPGSPALDAALAEYCTAADQRGVARPVDGDQDGAAACDIGAYEHVPPGRQRGAGRTGR